jgi:cyclohexa-1,5-dienecarbonyl-CoA hydratase
VSAALRIERDGAIARIVLDRPPLNVLSREMNRALAIAADELAGAPDIAVLVLAGGSARGFSAGVEVADHVPETVAEMLADFHSAIRAIGRLDCVTIAAIHGFALGGGLELALSCDLIVCEEDAQLGLPEIELGCYPPVGAALLPQRIGWNVACELVLSGEPMTPSRAHALGLVNRICATGTLAQATQALLGSLLAKSPAVLREAKRALRDGAELPPAPALRRIEERYLSDLAPLVDAREGIRAFLEKRRPVWRNR